MNIDNNKKRILVTGGSGLVGSAIRDISNEYMEYEFIFISSSDVNLERYEEIEDYLKDKQIDVILHLAAYVGGLYKNMREKVIMFEKNMIMNMNLLRAAHENGIQHIISCLSTCIFPDRTSYPINENMLHDGPPHESNDGYAYSKRMLDILSKSYRENYGRNYKCIIPTNIYGKHDNYHLEDGHVIPALIHKCYISKIKDKDFVVKGSGRALRQFIYSEDLARIMIWMIDNYREVNNLIISVDEDDEITIGEVAGMIADEYGYRDRMIFETNGIDGQYKKTADNSKLRRYLGEYRFKNMRDGIRESVKWFKENYPNVRK